MFQGQMALARMAKEEALKERFKHLTDAQIISDIECRLVDNWTMADMAEEIHRRRAEHNVAPNSAPDCPHCGGCGNPDRCNHCGNCKHCGKPIKEHEQPPQPVVPLQPPWWVPYITPYQPLSPNTSPNTIPWRPNPDITWCQNRQNTMSSTAR